MRELLYTLKKIAELLPVRGRRRLFHSRFAAVLAEWRWSAFHGDELAGVHGYHDHGFAFARAGRHNGEGGARREAAPCGQCPRGKKRPCPPGKRCDDRRQYHV